MRVRSWALLSLKVLICMRLSHHSGKAGSDEHSRWYGTGL